MSKYTQVRRSLNADFVNAHSLAAFYKWRNRSRLISWYFGVQCFRQIGRDVEV